MITTITDARIFDGERTLAERTIVIDGPTIVAVDDSVPTEGTIVDGRGSTLLPGLIDSHTHTYVDALRVALCFGVTTELEMMGKWTREERRQVAERDDIADLRTASYGMTAPGGHPSEVLPDEEHGGYSFPTVTSPEDAVQFVADRVAEGADYIKVMIEEGTVAACPGLPVPSNETITTAVREAHRHGKMAIAHAMTIETTRQAIVAGVDGLAHVFIEPHTPEIIAEIAESGAFVVPCLCVNSSVLGNSAAAFADDERVSSRLSEEWIQTLRGCFNTFTQGSMDDMFATVAALYDAGVEVFAGTDVSHPLPNIGGLAHGVSVHHELQLLVAAGLTPPAALRAATSLPADRFGLTDRGRIAPGARADLLLVDGDPTTNIGDTLSIRDVWRRGRRLGTL